jgi:hypothetical protein
MSARNLENRKEDFVVNVTIRRHAKDSPDEMKVLERVRCKVYLPEKIADSISLVFHLDIEQYRILEAASLWRFSIEGEEDRVHGHRTRISAKNVYTVNLTATNWSPEVVEAMLIGEPVDLRREHFRSPDNSADLVQTHGRYWLTPNRLLSPAQSVSHSYTGQVKVKTVGRVRVTIQGVRLTFAKRYRYRGADGETTSWSELVAEYELKGKAQTFEEVEQSLNELDDLLRFSSLAARHSCVCLGFDIVTTEGYIVDFYRRNISIPALKNNLYDELIDISNIRRFLTTCYRRFIALERDDLIRQAMNYAILKQGRTIESSFIGLYQALETLVLYYRKRAQLEMVFSEDEKWEQFSGTLKQFIKEHPLVRTDKGRRRQLYAQVPALQRVAFAEAFNGFCKFYKVDLSDLWPVLGPEKEWPLYKIRNKLVHGEYFNSAQRHSISAALSHLQWTVERFLLAILGWKISQSNVDPSYLSRTMNDHKNWESDRRILGAK